MKDNGENAKARSLLRKTLIVIAQIINLPNHKNNDRDLAALRVEIKKFLK